MAERLEELLPEATATQLFSDTRANDDPYGRQLRYAEAEEGADLSPARQCDSFDQHAAGRKNARCPR